jgi:hypothetical protein
VAGRDRMAIAEVVREVLREEHADVIRESVRAVTEELMEAEVCELIGAGRGERTEDWATHRNEYRARRWDTRAGEIELQIPKLRRGSSFPSFLQPRKRSEQALVSVVQQAYVCGVSTRRVDQLVESFGLRISRSEVSSEPSHLRLRSEPRVEACRLAPMTAKAPSRSLRPRSPLAARGPGAGRRVGRASRRRRLAADRRDGFAIASIQAARAARVARAGGRARRAGVARLPRPELRSFRGGRCQRSHAERVSAPTRAVVHVAPIRRASEQ